MIISAHELVGAPSAEWLESVESSVICGELTIRLTQPQNVKALVPLFRSSKCSVQLHPNASEDEVLDYLDAGVLYVVLSPAACEQMPKVPKGRIACCLPVDKPEGLSLPKDSPTLIILEFPEDVPITLQCVTECCSKYDIPDSFQIIVSGKPSSCSCAATVIKAGYTLQVDNSLSAPSGPLSIAGIINALVTSDRPDNLVPTVVVDEHQLCLGLVYSSAKSLEEAIRLRRGVYQSRKRGLWFKGETSGDTQDLLQVDVDCDFDSLRFIVRQRGVGFCHLQRYGCFGPRKGLNGMAHILQCRKQNAPEGSYTKRLFDDNSLLKSKLLEEAKELAVAETKEEVAWEAADVLYFTLVKCVKNGVSLMDVEDMLEQRSRRVRRRKGDAKPSSKSETGNAEQHRFSMAFAPTVEEVVTTSSEPSQPPQAAESAKEEGQFTSLKVHSYNSLSAAKKESLCKRPAVLDSDRLMTIVQPILADVRSRGDQAVLDLTAKFDRVVLESPVMNVPAVEDIQLSSEVHDALEVAYSNIHKFHKAQLTGVLKVETCPGVVCSRFSRPIQKVGLYVPGGSAILPSTALMLAIPASVAGCEDVILATPPRKDGSVSSEILYIAARCGIKSILLAGGAQAVAAMAYGTQSVPKVDKICGPGNSFVTMAKMLVQNDSTAQVSIDMPAGPSEVMVVADATARPDFVASDLLSQAEHGPDSQVVLVAIDLSSDRLDAIQAELKSQLAKLPRSETASVALSKSFVLAVKTIEEGLEFANQYAPEHLILNVESAGACVESVKNAGSVFVGPYSAESCGDYASGTNHTLPTYGYAKMYSGVSTATFQKQITSQELSAEGLANIGPAVATLAAMEGLDAHRNAVLLRLQQLGKL